MKTCGVIGYVILRTIRSQPCWIWNGGGKSYWQAHYDAKKSMTSIFPRKRKEQEICGEFWAILERRGEGLGKIFDGLPSSESRFLCYEWPSNEREFLIKSYLAARIFWSGIFQPSNRNTARLHKYIHYQ